MNTKVTIEGIEYNLDVSRAKELGLLFEVNKLHSHLFAVGDVFDSRSHALCWLQQVVETRESRRTEPVFTLMGFNGEVIHNEYFQCPRTLEELRTYLIQNKMTFIGNIQDIVTNAMFARRSELLPLSKLPL